MRINILLNFRNWISVPLMNASDKKSVPAFCYSFLKMDENHVNLKYMQFSKEIVV